MKHLPPSIAMAKGHMKQLGKNIISTKTLETTPTEEEPMETLETRFNYVFTKIIDNQQRITTNLTGRFPVTSNRGNKYLFVLYEYNRNSILVLPIKKKMNKDFIHVFQNVHEHLTIRGLNPNYTRL